MPHKFLLFVVLTLMLSACASSGVALVNWNAKLGGGYTKQTASYGAAAWEKIDVYTPKKIQKSYDVIVFIHGGRWTIGQKEEYEFVGARLAAQGYIVAIPDFRKFPEVRFPTFVEDAAKATAWVDENIERYHGNRARIFLAGHSSGAHVAALLTADERYLAAYNKDTHRVIKAFAGLAGPYAFTPDEPDLQAMFGPPSRYPMMQIPTFVDGREPPMLLQYGLTDTIVKKRDLERLAKAITDRGGRVASKLYPDIDHIDIVATFSPLGPQSSVVEDMTRFFSSQ